MDDLIADFVCEAREMLEALEGELVEWERDPDDRERLDAIFRFVHTVKGNCGFFDFPRLEALSHATEDALSEVRKGERRADSRLVDAVLAILDRIGEMVEDIEAGREFSEGDDAALIAALVPSLSDAVGEANPQAARTDNPLGEAAARPTGQLRTVRLPVQLLDRVVSGVSDMILAGNELARQIDACGGGSGLEASYKRVSSILTDLRVSIMQARMQPISLLFSSYRRLVRDLASELGKPVAFEIESGQVEIDREMIELVREPLLHLIRNAIDHGIELAEERLAAGKPAIGNIRLSARQTGNQIRIGIADDGRGMNADRVAERAIAAGVLTAEQARKLSPEQRLALICEPGFSTADEVTQLSGRGVGMDAVRNSAVRLGGSLTIHSTPGAGSRIILNVPLTLSIVPSITVRAAGQVFAIPRSYVDEIVRPNKDLSFHNVGGMRHVLLRGHEHPCFDLAGVLGIESEKPLDRQTLVMLKLISGSVFGLGIDGIEDHGELVIKPVAPRIIGTGFYVGVAQLDDGQAALALDIAGVAAAGGISSDIQRARFAEASAQAGEGEAQLESAITFDGFDKRRKAIVTSAVERLIEVGAEAVSLGAGEPQLVFDQTLIPLHGVDASVLERKKVSVLLLHDGERRVAYAMSDAVDTAALDLTTATRAGSSTVVLIDGAPVELVECHALFAAASGGFDGGSTCRLPLGDRWCRDFLKPLVEARGYQVVEDRDAPVDLAIVVDEREADAPAESASQAATVLKITSRRKRGRGAGGSIYRYDRDALVAALDDAQVAAQLGDAA
ncbi:MAG: chemotaxis protein CheA [Novosphingobium sp.]|nr:chemotaxis protein CheA [Novosphingobium sp.]